jgi:hypothetical protein
MTCFDVFFTSVMTPLLNSFLTTFSCIFIILWTFLHDSVKLMKVLHLSIFFRSFQCSGVIHDLIRSVH